jgi:acetyl-CoA acyltransferase
MSEIVGEEFDVSREEMDDYAFAATQKAIKAHKAGILSQEIVPVRTAHGLLDHDDSIKFNLKRTLMTKLKPIFRSGGRVTAYTASPMADGAAAVVLASEKTIKEHSLKPLARITHYAVAGCRPEIAGIGPIFSIPKTLELMKRDGISIDDIAVIELHDAFASSAVGAIKVLGLNPEIININGGSLALGHPLGASAARIVGS